MLDLKEPDGEMDIAPMRSEEEQLSYRGALNLHSLQYHKRNEFSAQSGQDRSLTPKSKASSSPSKPKLSLFIAKSYSYLHTGPLAITPICAIYTQYAVCFFSFSIFFFVLFTLICRFLKSKEYVG